ncbi:SAM-dependent methyltransferase [Streptomyces antioxidans]|uniref:SAM-dependent methyltransferase n=1 Tax=Streptomyces antioxidans TaxID=1507734 RepID=A0A1V4CTU3_9ACTN|nr:class I SAM-dependent methyltransferase [Streptomyces antioxidans]OPF70125.1 SAM-dependent methyltransferase [Streptomyces antioxidans]
MSAEKHERDLRFYNKWAPTYEDAKVQAVREQIFARMLAWLVGRNVEAKRILDVGCGTGAFLRMAAERFPDAELVGVDHAEGMIEVANEKAAGIDRLSFQVSPAEKLPFADDEFDLVVSTICFHHWLSRREGVAEISRVLSRGGHLAIADHFAIGWLRPMFALGGSRDRIHTQTEIAAMFAGEYLSVRDWQLLYGLGPLRIVHGVLARRV